MFGHKYRSCPNRTRNLVRHLEDIDGSGGTGGAAAAAASAQANATAGQAVNQQQQAGGTVQHQQPFWDAKDGKCLDAQQGDWNFSRSGGQQLRVFMHMWTFWVCA